MEVINFTAWIAQQRVLEPSDIVPTDDMIIVGKKVNRLRDGSEYQEFAMSIEDFFATSGNGYTTIQEEGTSLPGRTTMNFVGAGVTATDAGGKTLITIPGGITQAYTTVEDEGTPLTQRSTVNFVGDGVTVTDAGGKTVITIPSYTPPTPGPSPELEITGTLTAAQINDLDNTPIVLLPAQGAGKTIVVTGMVGTKQSGAPYTAGGGNVVIGYTSALFVNELISNAQMQNGSSCINVLSSTISLLGSEFPNEPLLVSTAGVPMGDTGTGDIKYWIKYRVIDVN